MQIRQSDAFWQLEGSIFVCMWMQKRIKPGSAKKKKKKSQLLFLNWLQYLTVSLWKVLVCTLKMLLLFCLNHLEINWECVRATELLYQMFYMFCYSDLAWTIIVKCLKFLLRVRLRLRVQFLSIMKKEQP